MKQKSFLLVKNLETELISNHILMLLKINELKEIKIYNQMILFECTINGGWSAFHCQMDIDHRIECT